MAIITLTTDFGDKDYSTGALKGALYKELGQAEIVTITHKVSPFNLQEGAYILKNAYPYFPKGTVHIIGIDSEWTPEVTHIALQVNGHYFICADNGIISLLAAETQPEKIVEIDTYAQTKSSFPVLDVFVKAACHIVRQGTLNALGKEKTNYTVLKGLLPLVNAEGDKITGHVIYVDHYGNVITNITKTLFEATRMGRDFELTARNYTFRTVYEKYSDMVNFNIERHQREDDGKKLAMFNSAGHLQLAIYRSNLDTVGGASTLLGLQYRDTITVQFHRKQL